MAFGDMGRMKRLASVVHQLAPDLQPRIDQFPPAPGFPTRAVVVDVFDGIPDVIPSLRLLAWPNGNEWRALKVVSDPETSDIRDVADFDDRTYSDESAPRWLFGAVWALLHGKIIGGIMQEFGVETMEELPNEVRQILGPVWLKGIRMQMIYES